jgi:hypothetical protein
MSNPLNSLHASIDRYIGLAGFLTRKSRFGDVNTSQKIKLKANLLQISKIIQEIKGPEKKQLSVILQRAIGKSSDISEKYQKKLILIFIRTITPNHSVQKATSPENLLKLFKNTIAGKPPRTEPLNEPGESIMQPILPPMDDARPLPPLPTTSQSMESTASVSEPTLPPMDDSIPLPPLPKRSSAAFAAKLQSMESKAYISKSIREPCAPFAPRRSSAFAANLQNMEAFSSTQSCFFPNPHLNSAKNPQQTHTNFESQTVELGDQPPHFEPKEFSFFTSEIPSNAKPYFHESHCMGENKSLYSSEDTRLNLYEIEQLSDQEKLNNSPITKKYWQTQRQWLA